MTYKQKQMVKIVLAIFFPITIVFGMLYMIGVIVWGVVDELAESFE